MSQKKRAGFISKYRLDVIVIAVVLLVAVGFLLVNKLTGKAGAYAEVSINGSVVAKYSLLQNGTFSLNNGTNALTIENGYAYMSYSNCKDHVCENMGKAMHVGESIICSPNRVTVKIVGETNDSVDLVS